MGSEMCIRDRGHDNHNIIVMGDSFEDMALAVNRCVELGGGQVIGRSG